MRIDDTPALQFFALICICVCSVVTAVYVVLNPLYNWDMLGYAASLTSLGDFNPGEAHRAIYNNLQSIAPAAEFEQLIAQTSYRQTMYEDADAFFQQVPYYKIRIIYLGLVSLVAAFGADVFSSMHYVSAFFAGIIPLVLYLGFRKSLHSIFWIVLPFFYFQISLDITIFQYGSVDVFGFFWLTLINIAFYKRSVWIYPLLVLAVLVRTDYIVYVTLLLFTMYVLHPSQWVRIAVTFLTTFIVFIILNNWSGNYGWDTLFYFVFVTDMLATHPENYQTYSVTAGDYINSIISYQWISIWFKISIVMGVTAALFTLVRYPMKIVKDNEILARVQLLATITIVSLLYVAAHYLLFPKLFTRFFFGHCLMMYLSFCAVLSYTVPQLSHNFISKTKKNLNSAQNSQHHKQGA